MDSNQSVFIRIMKDLSLDCLTAEGHPTVEVFSKSEFHNLLASLAGVEVDWEETGTGHGAYRVWPVKKADGFEPSDPKKVPTTAKAAAFDKLHKMALTHFNESVGGGYPDDDDPHYMYEAVMKLTLAAMGDDKLMWKAMR